MEKRFKVNSKKLNDIDRFSYQVKNVIRLLTIKYNLRIDSVIITVGGDGSDFVNNKFTLILSII